MCEWKLTTIGNLCDTISCTYRGRHDKVVLVNTSDVLEGKVLSHEFVDNKNLKGQFKKTFQKDDILYSEIRPANKRFGGNRSIYCINQTDGIKAKTRPSSSKIFIRHFEIKGSNR